MKAHTLALVVQWEGKQLRLKATLSDEFEIAVFEDAWREKETDPLSCVEALRERRVQEEEEFGDYVEALLCQPFVRPEIQEHGVKWLQSRSRLEELHKNEKEAAQVIADYACRVYQEHPDKQDFLIVGNESSVRVKIFPVSEVSKPAAAA